MPHAKGEKARIALLIVVAVLAIALALLEALADNPPAPATAAPATLSPALNPSEVSSDARRCPEAFGCRVSSALARWVPSR